MGAFSLIVVINLMGRCEMIEDCPFLKHCEHTLLFQGAEACLYILKDPNNISQNGRFLLKKRLLKKYRHAELDKKLTTKRITQEGRTLLKCQRLGIKVPIVYLTDMNDRVILMEYLHDYESLRNLIESHTYESQLLKTLAVDVAKLIAKMHDSGVIHGDLTTSNLLVKEQTTESEPQSEVVQSGRECSKSFSVVPIDFGLSSASDSSEDKAVDLYVLERAILTTHANMTSFFDLFLESYVLASKFGESTKSKLDEVRARGRKRDMLG